jgi:hypothetical protein
MRYKCCKFGLDWSIIKGTILVQQSNVLAVTLFLLEGLRSNVTQGTLFACATKIVSLVAIGEISWVLYLEYKTLFWLYLPFHCRDAAEISHITLCAYALQTTALWLRSITNEGHILYVFGQYTLQHETNTTENSRT